jgi:hypothetical protein
MPKAGAEMPNELPFMRGLHVVDITPILVE